jgi:hypothetical protein
MEPWNINWEQTLTALRLLLYQLSYIDFTQWLDLNQRPKDDETVKNATIYKEFWIG